MRGLKVHDAPGRTQGAEQSCSKGFLLTGSNQHSPRGLVTDSPHLYPGSEAGAPCSHGDLCSPRIVFLRMWTTASIQPAFSRIFQAGEKTWGHSDRTRGGAGTRSLRDARPAPGVWPCGGPCGSSCFFFLADCGDSPAGRRPPLPPLPLSLASWTCAGSATLSTRCSNVHCPRWEGPAHSPSRSQGRAAPPHPPPPRPSQPQGASCPEEPARPQGTAGGLGG